MSEHISKWFPRVKKKKFLSNDHAIVTSWASRNVHPTEYNIFMGAFLNEFPTNPKTESEQKLREIKRRHCKIELL